MKRAGFAGAFFCAGGRSAGVSPAGPACVPPPRLPTMLGVLLGGRRGWERSPAGLGRLFTKTARLLTSLVAAAAGRAPGQPARRQRSELRSQAGFACRTSKTRRLVQARSFWRQRMRRDSRHFLQRRPGHETPHLSRNHRREPRGRGMYNRCRRSSASRGIGPRQWNLGRTAEGRRRLDRTALGTPRISEGLDRRILALLSISQVLQASQGHPDDLADLPSNIEVLPQMTLQICRQISKSSAVTLQIKRFDVADVRRDLRIQPLDPGIYRRGSEPLR